MPIKSQRDKQRYIAFRITAPRQLSRKEFIAVLRRNIQDQNSWDRMKPWLTVFENNCGILRCTHTTADEARTLLASIQDFGREKTACKVETLCTSGTIKKAKSKIQKEIGQE
jgi:RNase P/RNase MRP subunit POP5